MKLLWFALILACTATAGSAETSIADWGCDASLVNHTAHQDDDAIHAFGIQDLQPIWLMPLSCGFKVLATFTFLGFDMSFKPYKAPSLLSQILKSVFTMGFICLALNGVFQDISKLRHLPDWRLLPLLVVTSSNYSAAMALWGALAIQSPVAVTGLRVGYEKVGALGPMAFPFILGGAQWLPVTKQIYAILLFPYMVLKAVLSLCFLFMVMIWVSIPYFTYVVLLMLPGTDLDCGGCFAWPYFGGCCLKFFLQLLMALLGLFIAVVGLGKKLGTGEGAYWEELLGPFGITMALIVWMFLLRFLLVGLFALLSGTSRKDLVKGMRQAPLLSKAYLESAAATAWAVLYVFAQIYGCLSCSCCAMALCCESEGLNITFASLCLPTCPEFEAGDRIKLIVLNRSRLEGDLEDDRRMMLLEDGHTAGKVTEGLGDAQVAVVLATLNYLFDIPLQQLFFTFVIRMAYTCSLSQVMEALHLTLDERSKVSEYLETLVLEGAGSFSALSGYVDRLWNLL